MRKTYICAKKVCINIHISLNTFSLYSYYSHLSHALPSNPTLHAHSPVLTSQIPCKLYDGKSCHIIS